MFPGRGQNGYEQNNSPIQLSNKYFSNYGMPNITNNSFYVKHFDPRAVPHRDSRPNSHAEYRLPLKLDSLQNVRTVTFYKPPSGRLNSSSSTVLNDRNSIPSQSFNRPNTPKVDSSLKKIETDNLTMFNDYGNGPGYSTAENFGQYSRVERSNTNHNLKIDTCFTTVYQNLPISGLPLRATLGPSSVSYMNKYESSEPETFKEASEGKQKPTNSVFVKDKYSTLYEELAYKNNFIEKLYFENKSLKFLLNSRGARYEQPNNNLSNTGFTEGAQVKIKLTNYDSFEGRPLSRFSTMSTFEQKYKDEELTFLKEDNMGKVEFIKYLQSEYLKLRQYFTEKYYSYERYISYKVKYINLVKMINANQKDYIERLLNIHRSSMQQYKQLEYQLKSNLKERMEAYKVNQLKIEYLCAEVTRLKNHDEVVYKYKSDQNPKNNKYTHVPLKRKRSVDKIDLQHLQFNNIRRKNSITKHPGASEYNNKYLILLKEELEKITAYNSENYNNLMKYIKRNDSLSHLVDSYYCKLIEKQGQISKLAEELRNCMVKEQNSSNTGLSDQQKAEQEVKIKYYNRIVNLQVELEKEKYKNLLLQNIGKSQQGDKEIIEGLKKYIVLKKEIIAKLNKNIFDLNNQPQSQKPNEGYTKTYKQQIQYLQYTVRRHYQESIRLKAEIEIKGLEINRLKKMADSLENVTKMQKYVADAKLQITNLKNYRTSIYTQLWEYKQRTMKYFKYKYTIIERIHQSQTMTERYLITIKQNYKYLQLKHEQLINAAVRKSIETSIQTLPVRDLEAEISQIKIKINHIESEKKLLLNSYAYLQAKNVDKYQEIIHFTKITQDLLPRNKMLEQSIFDLKARIEYLYQINQYLYRYSYMIKIQSESTVKYYKSMAELTIKTTEAKSHKTIYNLEEQLISLNAYKMKNRDLYKQVNELTSSQKDQLKLESYINIFKIRNGDLEAKLKSYYSQMNYLVEKYKYSYRKIIALYHQIRQFYNAKLFHSQINELNIKKLYYTYRKLRYSYTNNIFLQSYQKSKYKLYNNLLVVQTKFTKYNYSLSLTINYLQRNCYKQLKTIQELQEKNKYIEVVQTYIGKQTEKLETVDALLQNSIQYKENKIVYLLSQKKSLYIKVNYFYQKIVASVYLENTYRQKVQKQEYNIAQLYTLIFEHQTELYKVQNRNIEINLKLYREEVAKKKFHDALMSMANNDISALREAIYPKSLKLIEHLLSRYQSEEIKASKSLIESLRRLDVENVQSYIYETGASYEELLKHINSIIAELNYKKEYLVEIKHLNESHVHNEKYLKERLTNLSEVQNMDLEELKMLKAELSILKAKNEESEAKRSALEHMLISKNAEIASLISAKDQLSQYSNMQMTKKKYLGLKIEQNQTLVVTLQETITKYKYYKAILIATQYYLKEKIIYAERTINQLNLELKSIKESKYYFIEKYKKLSEYFINEKFYNLIESKTAIAAKSPYNEANDDSASINSLILLGESSLPNFIYIDQNALIYINELLEIYIVPGSLLKNIIEKLYANKKHAFKYKYLLKELYQISGLYFEILELFEIYNSSVVQAHYQLNEEIKNMRENISILIAKIRENDCRIYNLVKYVEFYISTRSHLEKRFNYNEDRLRRCYFLNYDLNNTILSLSATISSHKQKYGAEPRYQSSTKSTNQLNVLNNIESDSSISIAPVSEEKKTSEEPTKLYELIKEDEI